jgi:hypothetical protein
MSTPQVRSYPEKLIRWIPLPYWLVLILTWELFFLLDYFSGSAIARAHDHIVEYGCVVFFFALVCITIIYCSKVLFKLYPDVRLFIDHDETELCDWYQKKLQLSYEGIWPILFGGVFTIIVNQTVGHAINQFTPENTTVYYVRMAYEYAGFFFLGMGIWALLNVVLIPIALTRYKIKVSVNQVSGRGLQALGAAYFKMSLAITVTFIPLVVAAILSPLLEDLSILIWLGAGTVAIFGFFLLPQIGIHRIMAYEKQQRLVSFSTHLEDAMERSLKEPTSENMQRLKDYFELQEHLKNMNEWPFNVSTLWQLITALFIPVILAILEIFF